MSQLDRSPGLRSDHPDGEERYGHGNAIGSMFRLKAQAQALMEIPTEDGITTAGPTFEYVGHFAS